MTKFKIVDIKRPEDVKGLRYFVYKGEETEVIKTKIKRGFFGTRKVHYETTEIIWEAQPEIGFKTMSEAVRALKEIKALLPEDYFIK